MEEPEEILLQNKLKQKTKKQIIYCNKCSVSTLRCPLPEGLPESPPTALRFVTEYCVLYYQ